MAPWPRQHALSRLYIVEMNRQTALQVSEFSSLLQCSELDASSTKGIILSSKSDIHVMAYITLCHSLWWWHIPKICVTPCHDNVSQDMNRHLNTCVIISRQCHPLPWGDISRHCVIISRQCHPSPGTDILQHCVTHVIRQCKYSTSKIPINAYFHPGS